MEHCKRFLRLEKDDPPLTRRLADPSMFNRTMTDPNSSEWHSVAEEYNACGLELDRADNAMQASLVRIDMLLWPDPDHAYPAWHPRAGRKGSPRLFFFDTCERTIERVSSWKFKEYASDSLGLREEPEEFEDHLPDCLRYVATSFPEVSMPVKPKQIEPTRGEWQRAHLRDLVRHYQRAAAAENQFVGPMKEPDYVD